MIEIPDVVAAIELNVQERIKNYPLHTTRASSLGYFVPSLGGCVRRGVLERTSWQQKSLHDIGRQMIFDEGNFQEKEVIKSISDAGFDIIERSASFQYVDDKGRVYLDGTIDGKLVILMEAGRPKEAPPAEIKSMSPFIFDGIYTLDDFDKKSWTRAYKAQIQVYMDYYKSPVAIFFLKNKSTGQIKQINVDRDEELIKECLSVAREIQNHFDDQTLPDGTDDVETCKDCPLNRICKPDVDWTKDIKIGDDPKFEKLIERHAELAEMAKEANDLDKLIKSRIKATAEENGGTIEMEIGGWIITGKKDSAGKFRGKRRKKGVLEE